MWPILNDGVTLLVDIPNAPLTVERAVVGQLYIFKDGSEWVCHRYLGACDTGHVFKGDYSTTYECVIDPHILGHVRGFQTDSKSNFQLHQPLFAPMIFSLQKKSILQKGFRKQLYRRVAVLLTLLCKSFFYRKV